MHCSNYKNLYKITATNADCRHCVTLTFAERNRLALSLSGKKPLSAN